MSATSSRAETADHLISHVRIWTVAKNYSMDPSMNSILSELANDMVHWVISESTFVKEFGRLVRHVYNSATELDSLRAIVTDFAACVAGDVSALEGWEALLEDVPRFMVDLIRRTSQHLTAKRFLFHPVVTGGPGLLFGTN